MSGQNLHSIYSICKSKVEFKMHQGNYDN